MSFSERLLYKIKIDSLGRAVRATIRPPGTGGAIDKDSMRKLLGELDFSQINERGLELYAMDPGSKNSKILVLDNELAIYSMTTVADVVMRKNPLVNEMVKIRNIIKILSDKDVVTSRRLDSVSVITDMIIKDIDLSFTKQDVEDIKKAAARSLEIQHSDGVIKGIALFCELLDFIDHPFFGKGSRTIVKGALEQTKTIGPAIIYVQDDNKLLFLEGSLDPSNKQDKEYFDAVVKGKKPATAQGAQVFDALSAMTDEKFSLAHNTRADLKNK